MTPTRWCTSFGALVVARMEDNLAVPSKYRACGNDGSSDCRLTREGVSSHIGDGVTGDCRYGLNVGGEWTRKRNHRPRGKGLLRHRWANGTLLLVIRAGKSGEMSRGDTSQEKRTTNGRRGI